MKRSNRLILLIGIFLAVVAFIAIVLLFQQNQNATPTTAAPTTLPTVIAKQDVPLGTALTADMVDIQTLDVGARNTGAFQDKSQVIGQVVRTEVKAGQQIDTTTFAAGRAGAADITPLIDQGLRAVAISVDQVSGVGTLINVGDRVDLVAGFGINLLNVDATTQAVTKSDVSGDSVKLLAQNMQVVGTLLPTPPAQQNQNPTTTGTEVTTLNGQQEIVIVSATPQQAELIKFSQMDGNITLILRSPKDFQDANGNPVVPPPDETSGIVLKTLIDEYGVLPPQIVELQLPAGLRGTTR